MKVLEDTFSLIYVPTCFSLKCRLSAARRPPTTRLYGVKGLLFRRFFFFFPFLLLKNMENSRVSHRRHKLYTNSI
jgi:hypothetical protein